MKIGDASFWVSSLSNQQEWPRSFHPLSAGKNQLCTSNVSSQSAFGFRALLVSAEEHFKAKY